MTLKKRARSKRPEKHAKSTANTICVSLDASYVELLDRLARKTGSRSAALRLVLDEHVRGEVVRERESAYSAYYAAPAATEEERALTEEMLRGTTWPPEAEAETEAPRGEHPPG